MLTTEELQLFNAIKTEDERSVKEIISTEKLSIGEKNAPRIRHNAQDEAGNTFCHHAAKTGMISIIETILYASINFSYDIPNSKGELPEAHCRDNSFTNRLTARKKRDAELHRIREHKETVSDIVQQEIRRNGYKKGIIFTSNFLLTCKSKKHSDKDCAIPDLSEPNGFSIHDRQALDEAIAFNQRYLREEDRRNWLKSPGKLDDDNFLLANIGFVIGTEKYQKSSKIKRHFYSVPIYLSETVNKSLPKPICHRQNTTGHSEINLYDLLLEPQNLPGILNYFRQLCHIPPNEKRRIYACVIDIHSSQDVCDDCELDTYDFEQRLITLVKYLAYKASFEVSKTFCVAVRASSSRSSSYSYYRKSHHDRQAEPNKYRDFVAREYTHAEPMDLRKSGFIMLHYDDATREKQGAAWYKPPKIFAATIKNIPPRTLFFVGKRGLSHRNLPFPENYEIREYKDFPKFSSKKSY
jgi:hypothetical protein